MPFAPVVMDTFVDNIFDVKKSKYTAEFMTMLYDTKEEWHNKIPAVVHPVDKTARIQIVTPKSNPKFYELELYEKSNNIRLIVIYVDDTNI